MTEVTGPATQVALTGPWAGNWDPGQAVSATDNGDGTWSVTIGTPASNIEYLWIVNGAYENLIDNAQAGEGCAPVTDYQNYANRVWTVGSGNPSVAYGQCQPCPMTSTRLIFAARAPQPECQSGPNTQVVDSSRVCSAPRNPAREKRRASRDSLPESAAPSAAHIWADHSVCPARSHGHLTPLSYGSGAAFR